MSAASELEKAIRRLAGKEEGWERFLPKPTVGGRDGATAVGRPASASTSGFSFVEEDATLRTYHPERTTVSSDAFFSMTYEPIASIQLVDADPAIFLDPDA